MNKKEFEYEKELEEKKLHNIDVRIKHLKKEILTKTDMKIYCYICGKEIKWWEFYIPFRICHTIIGWCHRKC